MAKIKNNKNLDNPDHFNVVIKGFKTKEQAEQFLNWYSNSGEQDFGNHLEYQDLSTDDGCYLKGGANIKEGQNIIGHLD